jgi:alpha-L-rhamnosidase
MLVMIPWALYQHSGDRTVLDENYGAMRSWLDLMDATVAATGDLYAGFGFGDHGPPGSEAGGTMDLSPPEGSDIARNAHLYQEARTLARIAVVLGHPDDAPRFDALADRVLAAFNAAYLDAGAGEYRTPSQVGYRQTSNLLPLALDMVPEDLRDAVFGNLVADLEARGNRLNTGAIGTKLLLPVLTRFGRGDLAYAVATQTEYPSWGYWVTQGATSSWEVWRNEGPDQTLDHPFLGTVDDWLYQHLAGIQPAEPGYAAVRIAPLFPDGLDHVAATVTTPHGPVTSSWQRSDGAVTLAVTAPDGVPTELVLVAAEDDVEVLVGEARVVEAGAGRTVYRTMSRQSALRIR